MEYVGTSIKGIYRDVLLDADGQPIRDSRWVSNTVVTRCRVLLAGFMKSDNTAGIHHLAVVGRGDPLREFGLFGLFDGKDYMINCVRHPVIHKDAASTLVRVIRQHLSMSIA